MKKYLFSLLIAISSFGFVKAQVNVNINIGSQPLWGPAGYDHVDYYYLPDIETYYYVPKKQFIYQDNGRWVFVNSLPSRYSSYNLYNGYKVVINKPTPYLQFDNDRVKYVGYKNQKGSQVTIKQKKAKATKTKVYTSSAPSQVKVKHVSNNGGNGKKGNGNGHGKGKN